jgi:hypothetical protein
MGEHQYVFFFISSEGLKIAAYQIADTCIYFSHAEEMR